MSAKILELARMAHSRPPPNPIGTSGVWDQLGHVVLQLGQCLVERGEPGPSCSRELRQVGVSYLAVADDSLGWHVGVRDIVGPEFVPRIGRGAAEDRPCRRGRLALSDGTWSRLDRGFGHASAGHGARAVGPGAPGAPIRPYMVAVAIIATATIVVGRNS